MSIESTLNEILLELRKLTANLSPTEPTILPERMPSERDDIFKNKLENMSTTMLCNSTVHPSSFPAKSITTSQPAPPPLPSSVRMKWTPDYEQLIIDCANSPHGTYRNSVKRLTDKLPEGTTISAIRNKCGSMGYKIHKKYLVHK